MNIKNYRKILKDIDFSKETYGVSRYTRTRKFKESYSRLFKKFKINVSKEDIIIGSGTQSILSLICTTFNQIPKKTILLSNPTYQNAVHIFKNYYNIENINLEVDGWNMREFESILKKKG